MTEGVGIIVQARMGSTRLPGKVLREIAGVPMLAVLIGRLKECATVQTVIVATTAAGKDDPIVSCARQAGAAVYRGDEDDVLARYYEAAKQNGLAVVVRITADCPLADPDLIDDMVRSFLSAPGVAYLSNTITRTYPRGFDAEVFSFRALEEAYRQAGQQSDREHVTPYIYRNMPVRSYVRDDDASSFRVTVDTEDDFRHVSEIFTALEGRRAIRLDDVIRLLRERPDIVAINRHIPQKMM